MLPHLAIVGATGAVGQLVLQLLEERKFPHRAITFLASERSAGKQLSYRGESHTIKQMTPEAFADIDIAIGSTPDDVAREFVPWALAHNAVVVDESGAHRMQENVPLVVPEVNPEAIANHQGLIASPNCSTTQMVLCLKPLHDEAEVKRVIVATYQATSGAGVAGQAELNAGTRAALDKSSYEHSAFQHPIAFNVIPQIGSEKLGNQNEVGYTSEELKMVYETRKILGDDSIQVCPTCVRVPVSNCHSESIVVETSQPVSPERARELFESTPGISVSDNLAASEYPMPCNSDDLDDVFVGRIRQDISCPNGLAFWCVSDNLRKGAATNAVQIAELLVEFAAAKT